MAVSITTLIAPQQLTNGVATYYTSTGVKTRIDKLTLTNTSAAPVTVSLYLVASGGSAADSNTITSDKIVLVNETWNCPDMVGQVMVAGSTIQAIADTVNAVTISAGGAQIT